MSSDEHELEVLFRAVGAAPGDIPEPGFTLTDVRAASMRATKRRRATLIATVACLVAVLGTATGVGLTHFRGDSGSAAQPALAPGRPPNASPGPLTLQGSGGTGEDGPRAEGTARCEKVDGQLATALAGELPSTGTAAPSPGRVCTTGARSAGFPVSDGASHGFVSVTLFPPGTPVAFGDGGTYATERASSGGTLVVFSTPDAGSAAPFVSRLPQIAKVLAGRF